MPPELCKAKLTTFNLLSRFAGSGLYIFTRMKKWSGILAVFLLCWLSQGVEGIQQIKKIRMDAHVSRGESRKPDSICDANSETRKDPRTHKRKRIKGGEPAVLYVAKEARPVSYNVECEKYFPQRELVSFYLISGNKRRGPPSVA